MEGKNIVRVQKNKDYTVINNTSILDNRLSWKAKGLHIFMLSKPDDWEFYNEEIMKWATDGKASFNSGLKELKEFGYVKKVRRNNPDGTFDWVTIVYEVPQPYTENPSMVEPYTGFPSMDKPLMEKPSMENQPLLNTNTLSTELLSTNKLNNDDDIKPTAIATPDQQKAPQKQNAFAFYEQNHFGALGSLIIFKIDQWINDLSETLVIHAMEKAVLNGKTNWGYVETILKDWFNKKLFTLEAVEADDLRWKDQRIKATQQQQQFKPKRTYQQRGREEVVPEWFKDRNNDSDSQTPDATNISSNETDFEAERQKILAMLGKAEQKSMSKHQKIRNHLIRVLKAKEKSVDKLTDRALLKAITNH